MKKVSALILLFAIASYLSPNQAPVVHAADPRASFPVLKLTSEAGADLINHVLGPGETVTSSAVAIGLSSTQAIGWKATPASGSVSINMIAMQSNYPESGQYSKWDAPLDGSSITNDVTITTTRGGSPLRLPPSGFVKYTWRNAAAVSVTFTPTAFHQ